MRYQNRVLISSRTISNRHRFIRRPASHSHNPHARDINTALIKLYAESKTPERIESISHLLAEVTLDQVAESDANLDYIGNLTSFFVATFGCPCLALRRAQQRDSHDIILYCLGCEQWLRSREFHHIAALLAQNRGNHESAVDAWVQLVDDQLRDVDFPGES